MGYNYIFLLIDEETDSPSHQGNEKQYRETVDKQKQNISCCWTGGEIISGHDADFSVSQSFQ